MSVKVLGAIAGETNDWKRTSDGPATDVVDRKETDTAGVVQKGEGVVQEGEDRELNNKNNNDNNRNEVPAPLKNHRVAVLSASKSAVCPIVELERPIATYMTLPASQYSVLDAQRIERIDADTFRCYVGGVNFLSFRVEPVLTLSVIVGERGPTVRLLETTLEGSKAAVEANSKFTATMTNEVGWREVGLGGEDGLGEEWEDGLGEEWEDGLGEEWEGYSVAIASDATLTVTLQVPRWFVVPVGVVESSGSAIMQKILDVSVPKFLAQLQTDYAKWSAGQVRDTMDEDLK